MALNTSRVQTGLSETPEGVPDALYRVFFQLYTAIHNLEAFISAFTGIDPQPQSLWNQVSPLDTVMSGNLNRVYIQQFEPLGFGNCVSFVVDGGVLKAQKANATTNAKFAVGFVTSTTHIPLAGQFCEVTIGMGLITGVAGMIAGARYFLSTTPAIITNSEPVAAGNIGQVVGVALTNTLLFMNVTQTWNQH